MAYTIAIIMKIQMVLFVLAALLILLAGHALLYFSLVKFLVISSVAVKKILVITLGILSSSFLITIILVYWHGNVVFDSLYYLASAWLGLMLYLFFATVATWIIFLIIRILGLSVSLRFIFSLFISAAVVYSVYGLWNAQHPLEKTIHVLIPDLPASWQGRTAVQISDIHLGAIHKGDFFRKLTERIKVINPDIIFITGDLMDSGSRDIYDYASSLNELKPPLGIYFITGNHETYLSLDKALVDLRKFNMTILRDEMVTVDGVQLVGIDYPQTGQIKDVSLVLNKFNRTGPSIVLFHEPSQLGKFEAWGANLLLAGHTHVGQLWPLGYITRKVFQGNDYGLHTYNNFSVYTTSGVGTWGPPLRTGNRPEYVVIKFQKK